MKTYLAISVLMLVVIAGLTRCNNSPSVLDGAVPTDLKSTDLNNGDMSLCGDMFCTVLNFTTRVSNTTANLHAITYDGSGTPHYLAVGAGGTILRSSDGITWTSFTSSSVTDNYTSVASDGMNYVVATDSANGKIVKGSAIPDGGVSFPTDVTPQQFHTQVVNSVVYGGFFAAGTHAPTSGQDNVFGITDPSMGSGDWEPSTIAMGSTTYNVTKLFPFGSQQFLGLTDTGFIYTGTSSGDAITWTVALYNIPSSQSTQYLSDAAGTAGTYVIVGRGGNSGSINSDILSSPDGMTWTKRSSNTTQPLNTVVWNGHLFIAGGGGGTVLVSTDGANWQIRSAGINNINAAVAGPGRVVMVGDNGAIYTYED